MCFMEGVLLFCTTVSFPFMESLIHWIMQHLKIGRAMDFLAKSAAKIIEARKTNPDQSAQVSAMIPCNM